MKNRATESVAGADPSPPRGPFTRVVDKRSMALLTRCPVDSEPFDRW
jgi:hypothetical protein